MGVVDKALWLIETNLHGPLTLAGLADVSGVTPFHLSRSFTALTGQPVMRYVWRRRLTRAAEALVASPARVLTLALDAGCASLDSSRTAAARLSASAPAPKAHPPCRHHWRSAPPRRTSPTAGSDTSPPPD